MTRRMMMVLCLVAFAVTASGAAWASLPGVDPNRVDWGNRITTDAIDDRQMKVEQDVYAYDLDGNGLFDDGTFTYRYFLENVDGNTITSFRFDEPLDGGPVLAISGTVIGLQWDPTNPPVGNQPEWAAATAADALAAGMGLNDRGLMYVSAGPPDRFYEVSYLVNGQRVTTTTTGPTPEPCTLGLLGLSGLAMIRLFKRKRE